MRQEAGAYAKNTAAASTPATVAKTDTPSASAAPLVSVEPLLVPFVLALELPDGTREEIFGSGGGREVAESLSRSIGSEVPLLGQIPLDTRLRVGADQGMPVVLGEPDSPAAVALRGIAKGLASRSRGLAGRSLGLSPVSR